MYLAFGDQIQATEERLVHRREQHTGQHDADQNAVVLVQDAFTQPFPR